MVGEEENEGFDAVLCKDTSQACEMMGWQSMKWLQSEALQFVQNRESKNVLVVMTQGRVGWYILMGLLSKRKIVLVVRSQPRLMDILGDVGDTLKKSGKMSLVTLGEAGGEELREKMNAWEGGTVIVELGEEGGEEERIATRFGHYEGWRVVAVSKAANEKGVKRLRERIGVDENDAFDGMDALKSKEWDITAGRIEGGMEEVGREVVRVLQMERFAKLIGGRKRGEKRKRVAHSWGGSESVGGKKRGRKGGFVVVYTESVAMANAVHNWVNSSAVVGANEVAVVHMFIGRARRAAVRKMMGGSVRIVIAVRAEGLGWGIKSPNGVVFVGNVGLESVVRGMEESSGVGHVVWGVGEEGWEERRVERVVAEKWTRMMVGKGLVCVSERELRETLGVGGGAIEALRLGLERAVGVETGGGWTGVRVKLEGLDEEMEIEVKARGKDVGEQWWEVDGDLGERVRGAGGRVEEGEWGVEVKWDGIQAEEGLGKKVWVEVEKWVRCGKRREVEKRKVWEKMEDMLSEGEQRAWIREQITQWLGKPLTDEEEEEGTDEYGLTHMERDEPFNGEEDEVKDEEHISEG